jgi:4-hydroxythreonine-4-phosphate dehydrogenase
MRTPQIAITMGDPSGVGPETITAAWKTCLADGLCRPMVVGHPEIMRQAVSLLGTGAEVVEITAPEEAQPTADVIPCLAVGRDEVLNAPPAMVDPRSGQAAFEAICLATELALSGRVDAVTTAPISKVALQQAGHNYPGHTELLAELCGVDDFAMMLYLRDTGLGVVHVTLHTALRDVAGQITTEAVRQKIDLAQTAIERLSDIASPARIGVCALNPHAGEEGLFGDEEQTTIRPAVEQAIADGVNVTGPLSADTLMVAAHQGEYDVVVAMYHDQGHIALKLLGMHRAVNVTLGLPIIRTSVAHGTAFDLAWQGRAEASGMVEAIRVASRLAGRTLVKQ